MAVLTLGETMALFDPQPGGSYALRFGGAESNLAIALARLGVEVRWISRLGPDRFGDAFAAGFVYGLLAGWEPRACAHVGNVLAGRALAGSGDWESLPRLEDVLPELTSA